MFRLPSRLTFEALRSPLRHPLRLSSRHLHTVQIPFTGPPTYETIARRFSSQPNPLAFLKEKKEQEAIDRGEFIDIHDFGGVDPKDYDVLITDMDSKKLGSEVAEVVGIQYLAKATEAEANNVVEVGHAAVYGPMHRVIFPCVVSCNGKSHWVFFILDTGSPLTFLSTQACEVLGIEPQEDRKYVKIAGYTHLSHRSPKDSHFAEINLLGADFCEAHNFNPWFAGHRKVDVYFGKQWKVTRESKM